ncbi:hypothetical protein F0562_017269 [Nyssa sinensis]|uniref:Uncharacterized protein n=1 Tax=Nyssa sinensis TaxID=561372 RepID=A0A5J4ZE67_9ASTE|nr:hypothetical protein F0562_017269 [Nyssa sinensis]
MAEGIASSILGKIAENLVEPIGRQFGYIFCYNSNIDSLEREVEKLKGMRLGVQMSVDAGKRNLEIVDPVVELWLTSVDEMSKGAERIVQAKVEVEKGCLYGWCPNLKSRHSLSRKAKKKKMEVVGLQTNNKFDRVTNPAPPVGMPSTSMGGFKGLESRISITEEVLSALEDDTISVIGICGMGGVGKTTMVKEVAEKARARNLFDEVVMAVVSQNPDLTKIQRELGDMLGLKYDEQNILARAGRLCERLTNGNRILVILDDVWEGIDLGEVGIPFGADRKGCKVVLTSRLQRVCSDMGTQKDFPVQVLSKEEAWDLFKEMAGHSVDTVDLHPIAKEVAQECGGLPIALVTLGRALKNKEKHAWNDALQQLRRSSVTHIPGMQKKVYLSIELSYNYLESAQAKSLLLVCCLFPEDYNIWIEDLVRYIVGLRLFEDVETVAEARNRVYSVVDELRSCSLLLAGDEVFVKLHDVVRDVGIAIASKGEHLYLVRHDNKLEEWPEKERCEPCTAISLTSNSMHELPDGLDCPKLKLLQLSSKSPSLNISEDFFGGMKDLMVIGFRDVCLERLPPSFEFLMNLRTLCLHSCDFSTNISIIGSLTTLEILSFSDSHLEQLPSEIGQLCKLKLLDLRCYSPYGIKIPAGALSNLSKLEELYIGRVNWKTEEFRENASITELNSFSRLTALEILIDAEVLPRDFCFQRLMRFRIEMGHMSLGFSPYQFQNSLNFRGLEMNMILETNVNVLLKTTEILIFDQVKGMKNVLMELDVEGFKKLKELSIEKCDEVKYLIDAMDLVPDSAFVSLESINLQNMHNLKEICNGNPPVGFLSRLQRLRLCKLPAMKSLWWASIQPECLGNLRFLDINQVKTIKSVFTESIVKGLVQLQELRIGGCDMEEIVAMEGGEDDKGAEKIEFPNLNILTLEELPNLRSFYPKSDIAAIPSLFNQKVAFPSLESLHLSGMMNLDVIWHGQLPYAHFGKLREIKKTSRYSAMGTMILNSHHCKACTLMKSPK